MTRKKQVVKQEPKAIDVNLYDLSKSGMEELTHEDLVTPLFKIVQGNSQEMETLEDAKPGLFINRALQELYTAPLIVPVYARRFYTLWALDQSGKKGEVALHDPITREAKWVDKKFVYKDVNLVDTAHIFSLHLLKNREPELIVVNMAGSNIKRAYKPWMTMCRAQKAKLNGRQVILPMYANVYKFGSLKTGEVPNTWYIYTVELVGPQTDLVIKEKAEAFYDMIQAGKVRVEEEEPEAPEETNPFK